MTKELKMNSRAIAELVFHLGRIASGEGLVEGLTAAQWAVLRYFAQVNRFSRTLSAFAAFHGTTRGAASKGHFANALQRMLGQVTQERGTTPSAPARHVNIWKATAAAGRDRRPMRAG
jgi:hypothetical protein